MTSSAASTSSRKRASLEASRAFSSRSRSSSSSRSARRPRANAAWRRWPSAHPETSARATPRTMKRARLVVTVPRGSSRANSKARPGRGQGDPRLHVRAGNALSFHRMGQASALTVRFWGVRGSIACPSPPHGLRRQHELRRGALRARALILDAGTGIRSLGALTRGHVERRSSSSATPTGTTSTASPSSGPRTARSRFLIRPATSTAAASARRSRAR